MTLGPYFFINTCLLEFYS